jgi:hypothetical protein
VCKESPLTNNVGTVVHLEENEIEPVPFQDLLRNPMVFISLIFVCCCNRSGCVAQDGLEFAIHQPQPFQFWDYMCGQKCKLLMYRRNCRKTSM